MDATHIRYNINESEAQLPSSHNKSPLSLAWPLGQWGQTNLGVEVDLTRSKSENSIYTPAISFSSCQQNLIKTFQIEGMIGLITKMTLIFSSDFLNGQNWP